MAPPPALVDDVVEEILLRLPPDDPALLVRASLVCKSWRRLLTDAAFLRRYRRFHRAPPMLGFFRNAEGSAVGFVPTGSFRPRDPDHRGCRVLDCRHGRALLCEHNTTAFVVWDPATDEEWQIRNDVDFSYSDFSAAVLCATPDCDHLDCHGGPFLVVLLGIDDSSEDVLAHACVYSSEPCGWSVPSTVELDYRVGDIRPPFLVGDTLYFICDDGIVILRYSVRGERGFLAICGPYMQKYEDGIALIPMEDGGLRLAGYQVYSLDLWSLQATDAYGVASWTRLAVIDFDTLLPDDDDSIGPSYMIGFAKTPDSNVVFVSTDDGIYMIGLESDSVKKVSERVSGCSDNSPIFPYMSFFTPDRAAERFSLLAVTQ
ncbi:hypothetical protein ACP70R_048361 [Stipagrostis hirtigluma subsp. patula]